MRLSTLTLFLGVFALSSGILRSESIRLVGSDLIEQALFGAIERYEALSGNTVSTSLYGTLPGLRAIKENRADFGIIAIPVDKPLPEDDFNLIPIAYQVAYVVLNRSNEVPELSIPELYRMFAAEPSERIERWGQIGISSTFSSSSVQLVLENNPDTITIELFKYIALDSGSIRSNANYVTSIRGLVDIVSTDRGAIGIAATEPSANSVKSIAISSGEAGSFSFGPTPENVYYGDYPLRLPFYIALPKGKNSAAVDAFVKTLFSDEFSNELIKVGFMALPENVRKRTIQELDRDS